MTVSAKRARPYSAVVFSYHTQWGNGSTKPEGRQTKPEGRQTKPEGRQTKPEV